MINKHKEYLQYIEDNCLRCHSCHCFHATSVIGSVCFGELAALLLNHKNEELPNSIFGCNQCGMCLKKCPCKFNAKEFMFHARAFLEGQNQDYCRYYDDVRVDKKENIFSKLKAENLVLLSDALKADDDCARVFVPGCHMSASFPKLTNRVKAYLVQKDIVDGITTICCGNPLYAAGLYKEFQQYVEKMDELYQSHHVKEITTPCPSCYDFNKRIQNMGYLDGIEIKCLSQNLVDHNIKINRSAFPEDYKISIHDSCPDRKVGVFAESIRKLYEDFDIEELPHIKENTLCCGCGGLVPLYNQTIVNEGKELKQRDFEQVNSDCVITSCFNCYKGLKSTLPVHQYLEDLMADKS